MLIMGSCFVLTFYIMFFTGFSFLLFRLCPISKNQVYGLGFSFDFLLFYSFFLRLTNSLRKNKLSGSLSLFDPVGYRGFSFLSHAVSLWFIVFS